MAYCDECRITMAQGVAAAIPLSLANSDPDRIMTALYDEGFTVSDPASAAEVLQLPSSRWVAKAESTVLRGLGEGPRLASADSTGQMQEPGQKSEVTWDAGLDRESYNDTFVRDRDRLADAARSGDWAQVLELIRSAEHRLSANHWRLGGTSLLTPLHQAAWHGAPAQVVRELIDLGAFRTLATADGRTAHDVAASRGHHGLVPLLEPALRNPAPVDVLAALDRRLEGLIEARIRPELPVLLRPLPTALLTELPRGTPIWVPVPGMYGGFAVRLERSYLDVVSWSRVVGGSGQAHVLTAEGVTLVDEGFV